MAEKKNIKDQIIDVLKQFGSFVSAIVLCALGLQTFIKSTVNESVKTAVAEIIQTLEKKVSTTENTLTLLNYRMGEAEDKIKLLDPFEAILPSGYDAPKDPRKFKKR